MRNAIEAAEMQAAKSQHEKREAELALEAAVMSRRAAEAELSDVRAELSAAKAALDEALAEAEALRRKGKFDTIMGNVGDIQEALSRESELRRVLGGDGGAADDVEAALSAEREKAADAVRQVEALRAQLAQADERHRKLEREYDAVLEDAMKREEAGADMERAVQDRVRTSVEAKLAEHRSEQQAEIELLRSQLAEAVAERDAARRSVQERRADLTRLLSNAPGVDAQLKELMVRRALWPLVPRAVRSHARRRPSWKALGKCASA